MQPDASIARPVRLCAQRSTGMAANADCVGYEALRGENFRRYLLTTSRCRATTANTRFVSSTVLRARIRSEPRTVLWSTTQNVVSDAATVPGYVHMALHSTIRKKARSTSATCAWIKSRKERHRCASLLVLCGPSKSARLRKLKRATERRST